MQLWYHTCNCILIILYGIIPCSYGFKFLKFGSYKYHVTMVAITACSISVLSCHALSACYFSVLYQRAITACYISVLSWRAISACYHSVLYHRAITRAIMSCVISVISRRECTLTVHHPFTVCRNVNWSLEIDFDKWLLVATPDATNRVFTTAAH